MPADSELSALLARRTLLNESETDGGKLPQRQRVKISVYTEFTEFSRKQIKEYEQKFKQ